MPFIPHTPADRDAMLKAIGAKDIETLFNEIPEHLRNDKLELTPAQQNEMAVRRVMMARAEMDGQYTCFLGAGAYEHHIPAAVWELVTRGEFYSAYTPYQAEASQGTLQVIYEFQSMIAGLMAMEAANASLYEGASALAEAVLMAVRCHKKGSAILMPRSVHPHYRAVVEIIVKNQGIRLIDIDFDDSGIVAPDLIKLVDTNDVAALVIPQPNFLGNLEQVDELTDWAHAQGMLVIGLVNPVAMAIITPPGQWGQSGADIAVGEGQPLGAPLSSGGPYVGFMACKQQYIRQMPGRIIGRTIDIDGKDGFALTLQAREQHIRRSKATSNICTNQGLLATAATIHMALLGREGLERVAASCHANTQKLVGTLTAIDGVEAVYTGPRFHEAVLRIEADVDTVLNALAAQGIIAGLDLGTYYPELEGCLLVCATEMRTEQEMDDYATHLERIVSKRRLDPPCATKVNPD